MPLWLLWAASEYVLATRDTTFLDEEIPTWPLRGPAAGKAAVRTLAGALLPASGGRCRRRRAWRDAHAQRRLERRPGHVLGTAHHARKPWRKGESVLNSAMAAWVFDYYARMLAYSGDDAARIAQVRQKAEENRQAARAQWTGKWLRRAWLGPTAGWLGEKGLWLEPQPWAIIGGVTDAAQSKALIATMDDLLRRAFAHRRHADEQESGHRLAGHGRAGNFRQRRHLAVAQRHVWFGLWRSRTGKWPGMSGRRTRWRATLKCIRTSGTTSGAAPTRSTPPSSKHPGETVNSGFLRYTDFPIGEFTFARLHAVFGGQTAGHRIHGSRRGSVAAPAARFLPLRFAAGGRGQESAAGYEGWYAPSQAGEWRIRLKLPAEEERRLPHAIVNGAAAQTIRTPDGATELRGRSAPGTPLRWSLRA